MLSIGGLVMSVMWMNMFMCGCGHISVEGLIGTGPEWGLCIAGFALNKNANFLPRILIAGSFIISTLILLTNIHHVLWSGHNPLIKLE